LQNAYLKFQTKIAEFHAPTERESPARRNQDHPCNDRSDNGHRDIDATQSFWALRSQLNTAVELVFKSHRSAKA